MSPWFSKRHGHKPIRTVLQVESMDDELRNGLWTPVVLYIFPGHLNGDSRGSPEEIRAFAQLLYAFFLKKPIDSAPTDSRDVYRDLRHLYFSWEWYEVYDFIEYVIDSGEGWSGRDTGAFVKGCNVAMERELSGYRIVSGTISPIVDEVETTAIERAISDTEHAPWSSVGRHLKDALAMYSDRISPDYRNSVKESVSAIEAICRVISGKPTAVLSDGLRAIAKGNVRIHPALAASFEKVYGYTSDEGGIRHAMSSEDLVESEDALYILVTCSAFASYLMQKAARAGHD